MKPRCPCGKGHYPVMSCPALAGRACVAVIAIVVALGAFGCSGCNHNPSPTPAPVGPTLDAAAPAACQGNEPTCACLCEHRTRLGCRSAEPTPAGHTCLEVCANATDPGGPIQWNLGCRIRSSDCAEASCP